VCIPVFANIFLTSTPDRMTSDRNTGNDSYEVRHIALEYLKNLEFENADISAISEGFLANEDLWDNIRLISSFSSDLIPEYIYNLAGKRLDKIILLQVVCPSSVESIKFYDRYAFGRRRLPGFYPARTF
jgi:hypothetical protein